MNCRLLSSAQKHDIDLSTSAESRYVRLQAIFDEDICNIGDASGFLLFVVNLKACKALKDAVMIQGFEIEPYMHKASFFQIFDPDKPSKDGRATARLNVNVYGLKSESQRAGKLFSGHGIFLQRPLWDPPSLKYCNPQLISFPHLRNVDVWMESLLMGSTASSQTRTRDWALVLDDLPQYHGPADMENKHLMRTGLFRYDSATSERQD